MFHDEPVYVNYQTIDEYVREASYVDGAEYNISGNVYIFSKIDFWLSRSRMSLLWFRQ